MNDNFIIRPFLPDDIQQVRTMYGDEHIMDNKRNYMSTGNGPEEQRQQLDKAFADDLNEDPSLGVNKIYGSRNGCFLVLVEKKSDVVAGFVGLQDLGEGVGELRRMTIGIKYRGSGLGKTLLKEVVEEAKKRGFKLLTLGTWWGFTSACRFYEQQGGFVVTEREEDLDEEGKATPWGPWVTYNLKL